MPLTKPFLNNNAEGEKMLGKFGIIFFAFLALWLLWRSVILPLLSTRAKQRITTCVNNRLSVIALLGIFAVLLLLLLHLLGSGIIELMKAFGLEKLAER